jgi:hypothetical protein
VTPQVREFVRRVVHASGDGPVGAAAIQEWAAAAGIIERITATEPCGDACPCAKSGLPRACYRFAPDWETA